MFKLHLKCSDGICLASFVNERLEELLLADSSVVILVHRFKVLAELSFIKFGVRLDTLEHLHTELTNLRFFECTVLVGVNLSEKLFSGLH